VFQASLGQAWSILFPLIMTVYGAAHAHTTHIDGRLQTHSDGSEVAINTETKVCSSSYG